MGSAMSAAADRGKSDHALLRVVRDVTLPAYYPNGSRMQCPRCQHENETGAKFCEECAAPLARTCANCGRQLSSTAKFCPECAHPAGASATSQPGFGSVEGYTPKHLAEKILTSKSALEGERKQVTVLFADLKGSMELLADRDPEECRATIWMRTAAALGM